MYFAVLCTDADGAAQIRAAELDRHRCYLEGQRDKIVWAGARQHDDGTVYGSFYLLKVNSRAAAEAFVAGDPFQAAGLFARVEISNVRHGIFQPGLAPPAA